MQDHLRFSRGVANCVTETLQKVLHKNMHQNESQGSNRGHTRKTWQTCLVNFRQGRLSCHSLVGSLDGESSQDGLPSISLIATHEVGSTGGCNCAFTCVMTSTTAKVQLLLRNTT